VNTSDPFARRFVQPVEVRLGRPLVLTVQWADGVTPEHASRSLARVSSEEIAIVRGARLAGVSTDSLRRLVCPPRV
jgi:hypothetical protein